MRRPVIAGNWKMYKTQAEARAYFAALAPLVASSTHCDNHRRASVYSSNGGGGSRARDRDFDRGARPVLGSGRRVHWTSFRFDVGRRRMPRRTRCAFGNTSILCRDRRARLQEG